MKLIIKCAESGAFDYRLTDIVCRKFMLRNKSEIEILFFVLVFCFFSIMKSEEITPETKKIIKDIHPSFFKSPNKILQQCVDSGLKGNQIFF